jgi:hypothetical protein
MTGEARRARPVRSEIAVRSRPHRGTDGPLNRRVLALSMRDLLLTSKILTPDCNGLYSPRHNDYYNKQVDDCQPVNHY